MKPHQSSRRLSGLLVVAVLVGLALGAPPASALPPGSGTCKTLPGGILACGIAQANECFVGSWEAAGAATGMVNWKIVVAWKQWNENFAKSETHEAYGVEIAEAGVIFGSLPLDYASATIYANGVELGRIFSVEMKCT